MAALFFASFAVFLAEGGGTTGCFLGAGAIAGEVAMGASSVESTAMAVVGGVAGGATFLAAIGALVGAALTFLTASSDEGGALLVFFAAGGAAAETFLAASGVDASFLAMADGAGGATFLAGGAGGATFLAGDASVVGGGAGALFAVNGAGGVAATFLADGSTVEGGAAAATFLAGATAFAGGVAVAGFSAATGAPFVATFFAAATGDAMAAFALGVGVGMIGTALLVLPSKEPGRCADVAAAAVADVALAAEGCNHERGFLGGAVMGEDVVTPFPPAPPPALFAALHFLDAAALPQGAGRAGGGASILRGPFVNGALPTPGEDWAGLAALIQLAPIDDRSSISSFFFSR